MAIFNRKNLDFDTIVNVVVLEQTQNYSRGKAKAGLEIGRNTRSLIVLT